MDLLPKLTGESSSDEGDESDVYSPPASTYLNSSSGLSDNDIADVNDLEEESGSQPEVLLDSNEDGGDGMVLDVHADNSQDRHVVQVKNKKKHVRLSCS